LVWARALIMCHGDGYHQRAADSPTQRSQHCGDAPIPTLTASELRTGTLADRVEGRPADLPLPSTRAAVCDPKIEAQKQETAGHRPAVTIGAAG
jgi:hypothetical protein